MSFATAIIFMLGTLMLGLIGYGLVRQTPHPALAIPAIAVGLLAPFGALHAWGESQAFGWTLIYVTITLACVISAIRHLSVLFTRG